ATSDGCADSATRYRPPGARSFWPQHGKQDDVANVRLIREYHQEPVDPQPHATGGRQAVLERPDEVLVEVLRLHIAGGAQPRLLLEAAALLVGIVQLAEGVRQLAPLDEQLPALDPGGVAALELGERRQRYRIVEHEGRLDQRRLDVAIEDFIHQLRSRERVRLGDVLALQGRA